MRRKKKVINTPAEAKAFAAKKNPPARFIALAVGQQTYETLEAALSRKGFRHGKRTYADTRMPQPKDDCTAVKTDIFTMTANGYETETFLGKGFTIDGVTLIPYTLNGRTFGFTTPENDGGSGEKPRFTNKLTDKKLREWISYLKPDICTQLSTNPQPTEKDRD